MKKIIFISLLIFSFNCLACTFLNSLEEHRNLLKNSIDNAKEEITIISPYLSKWAIESDDIINRIKEAQKRGIKVSIYTDSRLDNLYNSTDLKPAAKAARNLLQEVFCNLRIVGKIHAKTLIKDKTMIATGSFNWLSALRDPNSIYSNLEHTIVLDAEHGFDQSQIESFIAKSLESINNLNEINHPYHDFYDKIAYLLPYQVKESQITTFSSDVLEWFSENESYFSRNVFQRITEKCAKLVNKWDEGEIEEDEFRNSFIKDIYPTIEKGIGEYLIQKYNKWGKKQ